MASVAAVAAATGFFFAGQNEESPPSKAACELEELPLPEGIDGPLETAAISDSGEYIAIMPMVTS